MTNPLNVKEASDFLKVTPGYIYNLVHYGKIKAYKPGGKKLLFNPNELEKYAYSNSRGGRADRAEKILNKKK